MRRATLLAPALSDILAPGAGQGASPFPRPATPGTIVRPNHLPTLAEVRELTPSLAAAAQAVYDEWDQDADGYDEELGTGGICDRVADRMRDVIHDAFPAAKTAIGGDDSHATVILALVEGVYDLDIPYSTYETGGGYVWRKIPGVTITADDVVLFQLSPDPCQFHLYSDEIGGLAADEDDDQPQEDIGP